MTRQIKFIQGNEACVEGALYAGLDFFAGYPITPSTEGAELLSKLLPQMGGTFMQAISEIASRLVAIRDQDPELAADLSRKHAAEAAVLLEGLDRVREGTADRVRPL